MDTTDDERRAAGVLRIKETPCAADGCRITSPLFRVNPKGEPGIFMCTKHMRKRKLDKEMHMTDEPMLEWFEYDHLPVGIVRNTSRMFGDLARELAFGGLPRTPERTVALRKLLEAKDAAVRCAVAEARQRG